MAKKPLSESFTDSLLKTGDVAKYCHTTVSQVIRWIKRGELKAFQIPGGHNRITIEDFKDFLERHNIPVSDEILHKVKNKKILIADDDKHLTFALKEALNKLIK